MLGCLGSPCSHPWLECLEARSGLVDRLFLGCCLDVGRNESLPSCITPFANVNFAALLSRPKCALVRAERYTYLQLLLKSKQSYSWRELLNQSYPTIGEVIWLLCHLKKPANKQKADYPVLGASNQDKTITGWVWMAQLVDGGPFLDVTWSRISLLMLIFWHSINFILMKVSYIPMVSSLLCGQSLGTKCC